MRDKRTNERLTRDWALHLGLIVRRHGCRFGFYGHSIGKKVGDYKTLAAVTRRIGQFKNIDDLDRYILHPHQKRPR
jgi:hypothetical protein